jgi:uncharacterized protein
MSEAVDPHRLHSGFRMRREGKPPELRPDGTIRLQGELEWLFHGTPAEVAWLVAALPGVAERLDDTFALVAFGNAVGWFDVPDLGRFEVVSGKWDESHFERMLRELTDIAVNLPFSSGTASGLPYDRSIAAHEDVLYHAFVYLRHILLGHAGLNERLLPALKLVVNDPHRRFSRVERRVPLHAARSVSARDLASIFAGELSPAASATARALPLAAALRGHLPETITETAVVASIDTPENRFAKAFLALCGGIIEGMRAAIGTRRRAFERRVLAECDRMDALLRPVERHPMWQEVGRMVHFPGGSTVLQRRRGYRELLTHWVRFRMATHLPLSAARIRDLLEVKDIAELYELWCFFSVVKEVQAVIGPPVQANRLRTTDFAVQVGWDLEVRWEDGTRVLYNPHFSRSASGVRHSYSVPLRPDIAIEVQHGPGAGLHLLDAKFKVEKLPDLASPAGDESDETEREERRGVFKRGDIYKMHTYRDAIPEARSVWILYPGTESRFFSASGEVKVFGDTTPLDHFEGVGALAYAPVGDTEIVRHVLSCLLSLDAPATQHDRADR